MQIEDSLLLKTKKIFRLILIVSFFCITAILAIYASSLNSFLSAYKLQNQLTHIYEIQDVIKNLKIKVNSEKYLPETQVLQSQLKHLKLNWKKYQVNKTIDLDLDAQLEKKLATLEGFLLKDVDNFEQKEELVLITTQLLIEMSETLQQLTVYKNKKISKEFDRSYQKRYQPFLIVFLIVLLFTITVYLNIKKISTSFKSSLNELIRFSNSLGKGDLSDRVQITEQNELSMVGGEFNRTMDKLNELLVSKDELEKVNEELVDINQELENFAYISSHDLKEPLRGISTYSDIILEDFADLPEEVQSDLRSINKLALRAQDQINSIMEYNKVYKQDYKFGLVDLNKLVVELVQDLDVFTKENSAQIDVQSLSKVNCDKLRIRSIFQNLITNAIKYNESEHKLVKIYMKDNQILVEDNGIGIPEEYSDKVFEFFKRLHGKDKFGGGSGAGLSIIKRIVERHGWEITVKSKVNEGSQFIITIKD